MYKEKTSRTRGKMEVIFEISIIENIKFTEKNIPRRRKKRIIFAHQLCNQQTVKRLTSVVFFFYIYIFVDTLRMFILIPHRMCTVTSFCELKSLLVKSFETLYVRGRVIRKINYSHSRLLFRPVLYEWFTNAL